MKPHILHPPQWPLRLLRFLLKDKYVEEIEGDMEEIFQDHAARFSVRKANRLYTWEMIKLVRPSLLKNLEFLNYISQVGMFQNYFKVSVRGLLKHPLNSFINLFGLAAAISICVFTYAFARWTFSRDQFHENKQVVFLTTYYAQREGVLQQYGQSPRPLAELLKHDFPQITNVCRVEDRPVIVKFHDQVFHERIRLTDPEFLDMFTFPLKWGSASSLHDVNSIIISEPVSQKYFGEANPVGEHLLVKFDKDRSKQFKITGVAREFPIARSMDFGFLINLENLRTSEAHYDFHDWSAFLDATFIQVATPAAIVPIQEGMEKYKQLQHKAVSADFAIASFGFEPLATVHLKTDDIRDDIFQGGSSENVTSIGFLAVICLLLLALACTNYINMAIVSAARRLKELGVRKSIGATRQAIIVQFLYENMVLTTVALLAGVILGWLVVIPWFERLWHFSMGFRLDDSKLWIYLPVILVITAFASGIYPSLYISRFQTVHILKGSLTFGQSNPITKVFLAFQLILACLFITSAVMFTKNTDYLAHRNWGYSNRDVLYAVLPDALSRDQLSTAMGRNPNVIAMAGSVQHIGRQEQPVILHLPSRDLEADRLAVDANYFSTMGIKIQAGRGFNDHEGSDRQAVVINETMARNLSWDQPIGQQFRMDSISYEVIGVVNDFHSHSFSSQVKSTFFTVADKEACRFLAMKVREESVRRTFEDLKHAWAQLFSEVPFEGGYQEDVWGNYYTEIEIHGHVWRVFASVAVILAALGLYGLVSLNVSGREKEFTIRKVLGASLGNIMISIVRQYHLLFAVGLAIGIPLSYYFITAILDFAYTYHVPVGFWSVALSALILVMVLISTISTQVLKVAKSNPANGLRVEK